MDHNTVKEIETTCYCSHYTWSVGEGQKPLTYTASADKECTCKELRTLYLGLIQDMGTSPIQ